MSDEIKKIQEQAIELGIYQIVRNIVTNGDNKSEAVESEWQNCKLKLRVEENNRPFGSSEFVTSVVMPNGLTLYRVKEDSAGALIVTHFRYGSWVEKIQAHSEQITATNERIKAEKAEQEKQAKLSPFSAISDDEFEKVIKKGNFGSGRY